jgi:hypothetical protein
VTFSGRTKEVSATVTKKRSLLVLVPVVCLAAMVTSLAGLVVGLALVGLGAAALSAKARRGAA